MPRFAICRALLVLWALGFAFSLRADDAAPVRKTDVFISGQGGYHTYRIPAVVAAANGHLLAFCEGRKNNAADTGDIDLLARRSEDGGLTWSEPHTVWDDDANVCGNPCPVLDRATGTLWLLLTWNSGRVPESRIAAGLGDDSRRVFVCHSRDHGRTWTKPEEITRAVKQPEWSWYATGPGAGIQIEHGPHRGRLVIPCDHKVPTAAGGREFRSHTIHSDDQGRTWRLGGSSPQPYTNECEVVELAEGKLLLNMRNYDRAQRARQVCLSDDGGATWRDQRFDAALVEPVCQASVRRVSWPQGDRPGLIAFSNPASAAQRMNLTVRASLDDAATWPHARSLHPGPAAYSCLVALPEGHVGCLYENGERNPYERITFARFPAAWLLGK